VRTSEIEEEFVPRTWTEPCVQPQVDSGGVGVSTKTVVNVEWEMSMFDLAVFSDGSSVKGLSACGAAIFDARSRTFLGVGGGPVGKRSSALTAEKEGLRLAVKMAAKAAGGCHRRVVIFTDSLEALRSLSSANVKSVVDRELKREVCAVDLHIEFKHVRGHSGTPGNEAAHLTARRMASREYNFDGLGSGVTVEEVKGLLKQAEEKRGVTTLMSIAKRSSQVAHAMEFTGLERNPVLKNAYVLSRREEILYNRLRVKAWNALPPGVPRNVGTDASARCPWCGEKADARHLMTDCRGIARERSYLDNFDCNEPILGSLENVAPFIRALVTKLCQ
jgi:ribonuclease HI